MMIEPGEHVDQVARHVIDAAIEVHRELGPGFVEAVYEAALCNELNRRRTHFVRQAVYPVIYKGDPVGEVRLDLVVEKCLIVELKSVEKIVPIHVHQVRNDLKATKLHLALLINFNELLLRDGLKRVVLTPD